MSTDTNITVLQAAELLGYHRDKKDRTKYRRGDFHVSIANDGKFKSWKIGFEGFKGYGSISFVMQSEKMDFKDALKLIEDLPGAIITDQVPTPYVPAKKEYKPLRKPYLYEGYTDRVKNYLCGERCLSEKLVENCLKHGLIYPSKDFFGISAVFAFTDAEGNELGFLKKYIEGDNKGSGYMATGSQKANSAFIVKGDPKKAIIFEAAIDLLSFIDLGLNKGNATLIATGGTIDAAEELHPCLKGYEEYSFAFDNDEPGRILAAKLKSAFFPNAKDLFPSKENDDYNNVLTKYKKEHIMEKKVNPIKTSHCRVKGKILALQDAESAGCSGVITHGHGAIRFFAVGRPEEALKPMKKGDFAAVSGSLRAGKQDSTNLYIRVTSAQLQQNERVEESSIEVTGNIASIKEFPKGILVSMINHEDQPSGKRIDTPLRYFLSGDSAKNVKDNGVGSYFKINGNFLSKKDKKTEKWFDNIFVTEVQCLKVKKAEDMTQEQTPEQKPPAESSGEGQTV